MYPQLRVEALVRQDSGDDHGICSERQFDEATHFDPWETTGITRNTHPWRLHCRIEIWILSHLFLHAATVLFMVEQ
jgi:hypothetical protein